MRAGAVGGVDGVDPALEDGGALVDVLGIGGIGRVQLGGDGELAPRAARARAARASVWPGRRRKRRECGSGPISSGCGVMPASPFTASRRRLASRRWQRAARVSRERSASQDERPLRRWSTGGWTSAIARALGHLAAALPGLHPDAGHLGIDLAMAVRPHAAAGSVAHALRAVHRAGHAGRGQDALAAHAAIEQRALDRLFDERDRPLGPFVSDRSKDRVQRDEGPLEPRIEAVEGRRMADREKPEPP